VDSTLVQLSTLILIHLVYSMTNLLRGLIRIVRRSIWAFALLTLCLVTIWAAAALYFDLPPDLAPGLLVAIFYLVSVVALLFCMRFSWFALGFGYVLFAGVALWWCTIRPADRGDWQPDVAQTAWTERDGDKITIHNLRNFDYRSGSPPQARWDTKVVDLSDLQAVDLFLNFWGSSLICHPIVSFQFGTEDHVAISVETRMTKSQSYSTIRGFFRQFTLIYIVADERDVIRVRTNCRHEQLYLYRTTVKPDRARKLFLNYLQTVNALHVHPQFYNALTSNCTTNVRTHTAATTTKPVPWDWQLLLNGTIDRFVYEHGGFASRLPFAELKARSLIDGKAQVADQMSDFSELIRADLPGFAQ
jgi:Domain of unknown function (DUF4105)